MKVNYVEENDVKKLNIKASNREMKILSDVVNVVYTLVTLVDRM